MEGTNKASAGVSSRRNWAVARAGGFVEEAVGGIADGQGPADSRVPKIQGPLQGQAEPEDLPPMSVPGKFRSAFVPEVPGHLR